MLMFLQTKAEKNVLHTHAHTQQMQMITQATRRIRTDLVFKF
jgi:hypothetical protein